MRNVSVTLLGIGIFFAGVGQAFATPCQTETDTATTAPIYTCLNGAETFPGTNVGTVGTASGDVDQIGDLADYNGGGGGAFVNTSSANPSIYTFTWGGGTLDIVGEVGNNGTITDGIDMELDTTTGTLIGTSSLYFPKTPPMGSANFNPQTLYDGTLAAGTYSIDTFAATTDGPAGDPDYQIDFTAGVSETPEPSSWLLLGTGLLGLGFVAFRKDKATALTLGS
jgi:hypothetical protein